MTDNAPDHDATLVDELFRDEGFRAKPYRCTAGKLTIGIGRNIEDRGITVDEARYLLRGDIALVRSEMDKHIPWWRDLDPVRRRVLENMCFNLGWPKLAGFKNTLAAIKAHDWERAAVGMLASLWAQQVGARAQRLATMMRTGKA
jgi:lysozyme